MKLLKTFSAIKPNLYILLVLSFLLITNLSASKVLADSQLSQSETQAVDDYPGVVKDSCSTSATSPGAGAADGSTFPNLDPTSMANAINTYITNYNPNSELAGLGTTIVASAKNSNVSPFIAIGIAQKESGLASPADTNVANANNSFGRTAGAGQPSWQGARAWYKWTSVKASVDYTAPENQNAVGGGDIFAYIRNQYPAAIDSDNLLTFFEAYNPVSDGGDPPSYAALVQSIISTVAGQSGGTPSATTSPTTTSPTSSNSGCSSASGTINCNSSSAPASTGLSAVRQNVVCITQQELLTWTSQPGYPWDGENSYSETGFLKYSENRSEYWCADFASWVYDQAKYPMRPDPNWNVPGVPGIQAIGEENQNFHWHPVGTYTPRPGDLAIYGGGHVNIVVSINNGTIGVTGGDEAGGPDNGNDPDGGGPYPGGSIVATGTGTLNDLISLGLTGFVSPD